MRLEEIGEVGLIEALKKELTRGAGDVLVGIGDDTAVLKVAPDRLLLATTDMLIAGEHFLPGKISPWALGYKAVAVNLSDIAAMGGKAKHILVALGIPADTRVQSIREIYRGMNHLAEKFGLAVVGGDTVRSPADLVINITVLGEVKPEDLLLRSTAQVGDKILVTGDLGRAQGGLTVLLNEDLAVAEEIKKEALERHFYPQPRLEEVEKLLSTRALRAANDVSDGLAKDLWEIADSSKVGAEIWPEALPFRNSTRRIAQGVGKNPWEFALYGGEDFELLLTMAPEAEEKVFACAAKEEIELTCIGRILPPQAGVTLRWADGRTKKLKYGGWDHFAKGEELDEN